MLSLAWRKCLSNTKTAGSLNSLYNVYVTYISYINYMSLMYTRLWNRRRNDTSTATNIYDTSTWSVLQFSIKYYWLLQTFPSIRKTYCPSKESCSCLCTRWCPAYKYAEVSFIWACIQHFSAVFRNQFKFRSIICVNAKSSLILISLRWRKTTWNYQK